MASSLLDFGSQLDSENPKLNVFERAARTIDTSALEAKDESGLNLSQEQEGKSVIFGLINKCKKAGKDLSHQSIMYANSICELLKFAQKSNSGYEYATI